jgi:hypothetical protein
MAATVHSLRKPLSYIIGEGRERDTVARFVVQKGSLHTPASNRNCGALAFRIEMASATAEFAGPFGSKGWT